LQTPQLGDVKPNSLWLICSSMTSNQGIARVGLRTILPWPHLKTKLKHTNRLEIHIKTGSENQQIEVRRKGRLS
jgi:hypothetical protein